MIPALPNHHSSIKDDFAPNPFLIMFYRFLLFLGLAVFPSLFFATSPVDSMKNLYYQKEITVDSQRLLLCKDIGDSLKLSAPDSAAFYYKVAIKLAREQKDTARLIWLLADVGDIQQRIGRDLEALDYLRKSYLLAKAYGNANQGSMAYLLINIGNIYFADGVYSVARGYYNKARVTFEEIADTNGVLLCWKNIGLIFDRQDQCDSSIFYYKKALDVEMALQGRAHEKAILYNYISLAYGCYKVEGTGAERVRYMRLANKYFEKAGGEQKNPKLQLSFYYNFTSAFRMAGQVDSALHYARLFDEAYARWPEYQELFRYSRMAIWKGIAASQGDYQKAIRLSYQMIEDSIIPASQMYRQYQVLASLYVKVGNYKKAFFYEKKYAEELARRDKDKFADKVVKMYAAMENSEQRRALELKDLALQKEQALKEQEARAGRIYIIALVILLILLGASGFLYYRLRRSKDQLHKQKTIIEDNAAELSALNQTKDKLMSILAHDLRGPFSNMLQLSERLSKQLSQQPMASRSQDLAEGLARTSKSSYLLFEDLLSWSKNQSGALELQPRPIALPDMAAEILELFQSQLYEKSIRVKQDWKARGIQTDEHLLRTILRNLIGNALKYSPRGASLILRSWAEEQMVKVEIVDEAGGIPSDMLSSLFSEERWKQRKGNSGLGLVLCQQFMEKQGGRIVVDSKVGQGSRFTLLFPDALVEVDWSGLPEELGEGLSLPSVAKLSMHPALWQQLLELSDSEATALMRVHQQLLEKDGSLKPYLDVWRDALLQQDLTSLQRLRAELQRALSTEQLPQARA